MHNDEQPATPEQIARWNGSSKVDIHLTKREYFAAIALQGLLAGYPPDHDIDVDNDVIIAVEYADALLLQLQKRP